MASWSMKTKVNVNVSNVCDVINMMSSIASVLQNFRLVAFWYNYCLVSKYGNAYDKLKTHMRIFLLIYNPPCLCRSEYIPPTSSPPSTPRTNPPLFSSAGLRSLPVAPLRLGVAPPPIFSITPKKSQAPPTSHQPYYSTISSSSSTSMCFNPIQPSSESSSLLGLNDNSSLDVHIPPPHEANGGAPKPTSGQDHASLLRTQMGDASVAPAYRVISGLKKENKQPVAFKQNSW